MTRHFETVVLDSQGLSLWVGQDRGFLVKLSVFHEMGAELVVGANTIVEVGHAKVNIARLQWTLSRVRVETVTEAAAKAAVTLLKQAGLHGHKYAIDATVAEMALRQPGPVAVVTSDCDDIARLCGDRIHIIRV
ncbi:DNA-binding protein [Nocardia sp. 2YAB30]|uniref:DNA-binding protein n=1 Tax=Nocardia sp. 2YAB30 TaxID=3233022 RepID=UPI003F9CE5EF